MLSDSELLNLFVRDRSQDALRTLFERHLKMVYAAALRQVGDPGMAQDIVQGVFIALVDKAPVLSSKVTMLPAWLLAVTRYAALTALKRRAVRMRCEKKGAMMERQSPPSIDSEKLNSIIDLALNRLSSPDRTAIAVYYLENRSLRDVGAALAVSEAAAQKRLGRALLRLRNILTHQGVTCPADVLEANLRDFDSVAVPPPLLAAAMSFALHPSMATSSGLASARDILRSLLMNKVKAFALSTLVAAAVAAPAVPLVYHAFAASTQPPSAVFAIAAVKQASQSSPTNIPDRSNSSVTDMGQRILSLNSLHLKGAIYAPDGPHPIELFAQQPDLCRVNGHYDSGPNGSLTTDVIITAEHLITLDPADKKVTIEPLNRTDAEYQVANVLQNFVQVLFGADQNFTKLRSETLSGIQTDVYQVLNAQQARIEVWVNPVTGLPVKAVLYQTSPNQPDQPIGEFDTIEPNPSISAAVFAPKIPSDYTIIQIKLGDAANDFGPTGGSESSFGNMRMGIRYVIALGNGDVLICWYLYDGRNPADDLKLPDEKNTLTISSMTGMAYSEHLLHADATQQGFHWRWSLLRPAKPINDPASIVSILAKDASGNSDADAILPVIFLPKDLPDIVENLQLQTLPVGYAPMTLTQIEALSNIEPAPVQ